MLGVPENLTFYFFVLFPLQTSWPLLPDSPFAPVDPATPWSTEKKNTTKPRQLIFSIITFTSYLKISTLVHFRLELLYMKPCQTIAIYQLNISQHYWSSICRLRLNDRNIIGSNVLRAFGHPVAMCCDVLGIENRTSVHAQAQHCCTNLAKRLQNHATFTNVAWKIWPPNISQHLATLHNRVAKRAQHVAPTNVAIYVALKC